MELALVEEIQIKESSKIYELLLKHYDSCNIKKVDLNGLEDNTSDVVILESDENIKNLLKNSSLLERVLSSKDTLLMLLVNNLANLNSAINVPQNQSNLVIAINTFNASYSHSGFTLAWHKEDNNSDNNLKKISNDILNILYSKVHWAPSYKELLCIDKYCYLATLVGCLTKTCIENSAKKVKISGPINIDSILSQGFISTSALMNEKNLSCAELESSVSTPGGITATFNNNLDSNNLPQKIETLFKGVTPLNRDLRF